MGHLEVRNSCETCDKHFDTVNNLMMVSRCLSFEEEQMIDKNSTNSPTDKQISNALYVAMIVSSRPTVA